MLLTMNRRTFLGWTGGLLAGLGGLFGAKRALGATPEPKAAPRASQGDFQFIDVSWVKEGGEPIQSTVQEQTSSWERLPGQTRVKETDFWDMCDHIVEHVGQTGEPVFSYDEPHRLTMGFTCDTKCWQIKVLSDLGRSLDLKPEKAELVRPYVKTQEGRVKLAAALQGSGMSRYRPS
jgi:hypothetical protein